MTAAHENQPDISSCPLTLWPLTKVKVTETGIRSQMVVINGAYKQGRYKKKEYGGTVLHYVRWSSFCNQN